MSDPTQQREAKLHPDLRRALVTAGPDEVLPVIIRYRREAGAAAAQAMTPDLVTTMTYETLPVLAAEGTPPTIVSLAENPSVERIWYDLPVHTWLDVSVPLIEAPRVWENGRQGTGVKVAILDTGVDLNHPDLKDRIRGSQDFSGKGNVQDGNGHGTHVAGIIVGQGVGNGSGDIADTGGFLYGLGAAPGARVYAFSTVDCGAPWPPAGGWQELSKRGIAAGTQGANASWTTGEGTAHGYKASERTFDTMIRDGDFDTPAAEPYIFVFSAGNSGPNATTLTAPKEAKNPIIVASSRNYRVGAINTISSFSSRGPAVDGRTLPNVAAPGESIASTKRVAGASSCATSIAGTANLYALCSGTSMAAPSVSGSAALLIEKWRTANGGATPSPAMVKALLVNGAVPSDTTPIPNNNQGWGRVHLGNSLALNSNAHYIDQTELLTATGTTHELVVGVVDTSKPLRVTLTWTDAPGAINANPALVNNLDLEVVDGANTYLGNVFNNGASVTGGTADAKNNVENVYITNPGGAVTIRVKGTAIVGDGVPGNATPLDQDFALVCTNCVQQPTYTLTVDPTSAAICAPADGSFDIDTSSVLGYADPITLAAGNLPGGANATFSANPLNPGDSATLTLGNTAAVTPGTYTFQVNATSTSGPQSRNVGVHIAGSVAAAPALTAPADNAGNVAAMPTFTWAADPQAQDYTIEIASDAAFTTILATATVSATTYSLSAPLATSTRYWWRVRGNNGCGTGTYGTAFSFTTIPAPGDCPLDAFAVTVFEDSIENGTNGWSTSSLIGTNTWSITAAQSLSPTHSWFAPDVAATSDTVLVSPTIAVPDAASAPQTLEFHSRHTMEASGTSACYDGGLLEVSVAGGAFNPVLDAQLLTNPYTGAISSSFSNPLAGRRAWCGTKPFTRTIVDLSSYAGQNVQFRFRIGTDSSVGAEGWYIDDVKVKGCATTDVIFADGFDD
ncbi:MAG: S8 family serine peptidase [Dokdonella sp.]|nr:S8 family serine peptidase [Dokdonella sp.]